MTKKNNNLIRFDWALKRLLRNKANYKVLEGFLSVLLNQDVQIQNILDTESNQEHNDDKFNRVDIMVENAQKELFIIEVQIEHKVDYFYRMLYGVSKAITEHMYKGDDYKKVRKVYHINIVYFELGQGDDYIYYGSTEFRGAHRNDILKLTSKQQKLFGKDEIRKIYPEYYILRVEDFDNVAKDSIDEWIYYLKNDSIPDEFSAKGLAEARELLQYDSLSEKDKKNYDHHIEQIRHEHSIIETNYEEGKDEGIKVGREEGLKEGMEKGMKKGKKEGMKKGMEKGRKEGKEEGLKEGMKIVMLEKAETVKKLSAMNWKPDDIAKLTKLTTEQVLKIIEEN